MAVHALVVVADIKPCHKAIAVGQSTGKAHGSLDTAMPLDVTAARTQAQLLLYPVLVASDDSPTAIGPADILVTALAPLVFEL